MGWGFIALYAKPSFVSAELFRHVSYDVWSRVHVSRRIDDAQWSRQPVGCNYSAKEMPHEPFDTPRRKRDVMHTHVFIRQRQNLPCGLNAPIAPLKAK